VGIVLGIDLDNTIVSYDRLFADAAARAGLVEARFHGSKYELRERLRASPGGEAHWTALQGEVYGPRMRDAVAFAGAEAFVERARAAGVPVYVVSHKTEYAAGGPSGVNLHDAARVWLSRTFVSGAFAGVYFEATRGAKIARIAALRCTHFIDDLAEVFLDPSFPGETARWLFDPHGMQPAVPSAERFTDWMAIEQRIVDELRVRALAADLSGETVEMIARLNGGGNNRIYRVRTGSHTYALKDYGIPDERRRLRHEFDALTFLWGRGERAVPAAVACDERAGAALYEWIDGVPPTVSPGDVAEALDFVQRLYAARLDAGAAKLESAADAGLCIMHVWQQIDARVARLRACAEELRAYLDELAASLARERQRVRGRRDPEAELPPRLRTLSPSDFGFHNALRRKGRLVFFDFEYFGWDDPVKLACDVALHPGIGLGTADRKEWVAGTERIFGADPDFLARLDDCYPTYALKWCTILLNEFRPEVWERRASARRELDRGAAKAAQFTKAQALLERVRAGESLAG